MKVFMRIGAVCAFVVALVCAGVLACIAVQALAVFILLKDIALRFTSLLDYLEPAVFDFDPRREKTDLGW